MFPRNRTVVFTHWSGSYRTQHDNVENFNWWLPGNSHARHASEKGLIEHLFYTNLNDGKIIPWMGESFEYNDTLDESTSRCARRQVVRRSRFHGSRFQIHRRHGDSECPGYEPIDALCGQDRERHGPRRPQLHNEADAS